MNEVCFLTQKSDNVWATNDVVQARYDVLSVDFADDTVVNGFFERYRPSAVVVDFFSSNTDDQDMADRMCTTWRSGCNIIEAACRFEVPRLIALVPSTIYSQHAGVRSVKEADFLTQHYHVAEQQEAFVIIPIVELIEAYNRQWGTLFTACVLPSPQNSKRGVGVKDVLYAVDILLRYDAPPSLVNIGGISPKSESPCLDVSLMQSLEGSLRNYRDSQTDVSIDMQHKGEHHEQA